MSSSSSSVDIHVRMSKKVSQLTKVIFLLNTKCDEHEYEKTRLTERHRAEIEAIKKDANARVKAFQQQTEQMVKTIQNTADTPSASSASSSSSDPLFEQLQKKFDDERRQCRGDLTRLASQVKDAEAAWKAAANKEIEAVKREVEEAKTSALMKIHSVNKWLKAAEADRAKAAAAAVEDKKAREKELENERAKSKAEVDEWRRKYEESTSRLQSNLASSLSELTESQQAERERLRQAMEAALADKEAELNKLEKKMIAATQTIKQQEKQIQSLDGQLLDVRSQLADAERRAESRQREHDKAMAEAEAKYNKNSTKSQAAWDEQLKAHVSEVDRLRSSLSSVECELLASQTRGHELANRLGALESSLTSTQSQSANEAATLKSALDTADARGRELADWLKAARAEAEALKAAGANKERQIAEAQKTIEGLTQELAAANAAIADIRLRLDRSVSECAAANAAMARLREEADDFKAQQAMNHSEKESAIKEEAERALNEWRAREAKWVAEGRAWEAKAADWAAASAAYEERLKAQQAGAADEHAKARAQAAEELAALQSTIARERESRLLKERELTGEQAIISHKLSEAQAELKRLNSSASGQSEQIQALQQELAQVTEAARRRQAEADESAQRAMSSIEALQRDKINLSSQLAREVNLVQELRNVQSDATAAEGRLRREAEQLRKQLAGEQEEARRALEEQQRKASEQMAATVGEHERRIAELESEWKERVRAQETLAATQLTALAHSHKGEVDRLRLQADKDMDDALARWKHEEEERVRAAKSQHELHERQQLEALSSRLEASRQETVKTLTSGYEARLTAATASASDYKGRLTDAEHKMSQLAGELQRLLGELTAVKAMHDERQREWLSSRMNILQEAQEKADQAHAQHERAIRQMQAEHQEQLRDKDDQAAQSDARRVSELDALAASLAALQRRYDNRESRAEDIERIKAGEQRILALLEERKKLIEEAKYFKLELVNRDDNYNKIFGKSPVVGNLMSSTQAAIMRNTPTSEAKDGAFSFNPGSTKNKKR